MRRGPAIALTAVASGLLSVLLAVAVNVATGGSLPGPLAGLTWLAWPTVGVFALITVGLAVWQQRLDRPDHPAPAPRHAASRAPGPPPAELPAPPAVFAGRAGDLAAAAALAAEYPVVALVGPPGAGKTTLALRFAHGRRADYPDGQLFALLRGADPEPVAPGAVLARFLRALGVPDDERRGPVDDLAARLRSALDGRRVLLLLDDARDAAQVRPLLPGGSGCLVVVTSRRMLGDLPGAGQHAVGAMAGPDARELLAAAAGPERMAADPQGVDDLLRYCAGLPLALGIAAARLRSRPAWRPGDLARQLATEHRRLDELHLGDLAVRSAFTTSYTALPGGDRLVFRRAGGHPGRQFGAGDAAALAGVTAGEAAEALERLVDAHLVESPAAGRYLLHDLLRLFAAERMAAEEPAAERADGLVRLLTRLAAAAGGAPGVHRDDRRGGDPVAHRDHVRASPAGEDPAVLRDNVLAAVHAGVRAGAYGPAFALAEAAGPAFRRAGDQPDLLAMWSDALVAANALGDDRRRVRALRPVTYGLLMTGRGTEALQAAEEAVTLARRVGEPEGLAYALFGRGRTLRNLFRYAEAEDDLTAALDRFTALADTEQQIEVLNTLGTMYNAMGRAADAVPVLERAMALPRREVHAWTMQALSVAYQQTGRAAEAAQLNRRVLDLARRTDDELTYAYALLQRGWNATAERRYAEASADMRAAVAVFERIRNPGGLAGAHEAVGVVAALSGRFADALPALDTAIGQFAELGSPVEEGRSRLYRAYALAELGRVAEARAEADAAGHLIGAAETSDLDWVRDHLSGRLAQT